MTIPPENDEAARADLGSGPSPSQADAAAVERPGALDPAPPDPLDEDLPDPLDPAPPDQPDADTLHADTLDAGPRPARTSWPWQVLRGLGVAAVVLLGSTVGAVLAPATTTHVGPLTVQIQVVPDWGGGMQVLLPPAGEVEFNTHAAPIAVQASVQEVDLESARRVLDNAGGLAVLGAQAPDLLRRAAVQAALTTLGCALAGATVASLLVYRTRWRRLLLVTGSSLTMILSITGVAAITFDADSFAQPRFTGLLSQAPYLTNRSSSLADRLESYRSGLADIVSGVTGLYATTGNLPVVAGAGSDDVVTLLHVSDIHLNPLGYDLIDRLIKQFGVDLVVDTGDVTTWGTSAEDGTLARIGELPVPYVFVRGNHDSTGTEAAIRRFRNATVLDGDVATVAGVTIAGIGDPVFTPDAATMSQQAAKDQAELQVQSGQRLADVVRAWDEQHPDETVGLAALHDPAGAAPLYGYAPTVLAGHTHSRAVTIDSTGTVQLVEGSTGGAGITARGLERLRDGEPLPLQATVVYLARSGPREGRVIGYDEVTVGGYGLASATLQRHVLRADEVPALRPPPPPTPSPSPSTSSESSSGTSSGVSSSLAVGASTAR